MTFSITRLAGSQALITGTDKLGTSGQVVVSTEEWDDIKQHKNYHAATEVFDAKVEEFFKDILDAAAEVAKVLEPSKVVDPLDFVVFDEGTEGVAAVEPEIKRLGHDSKVLRLIEEGQADRLLWVHDELVITEYVTPAQADDTSLAEMTENLRGMVAELGVVNDPEPSNEG